MEESDASKNRCMLYKVAPNSVRTASKKTPGQVFFHRRCYHRTMFRRKEYEDNRYVIVSSGRSENNT
jgi:hypothetical protein